MLPTVKTLIKVTSFQSHASQTSGVQGPRTSIEQRCIKSCLHGPKVIRTYINELVIATSELEARASLLYTLSLLRCSEQEGIVPVERFSQIFRTRCLGVARSSKAECTFKPSAICQRYLTDARPCGPHRCRITTSLLSASSITNWGVECIPWS